MIPVHKIHLAIKGHLVAEVSEDEKVTLGNEKIDQVDSFTYLGSIITKDGGSSYNVISRLAETLTSVETLISVD